MEIELRKLVGHRVMVVGPRFLENEKPQSVKLLAVEEAGIWIESQGGGRKTDREFAEEAVFRRAGLLYSLCADYEHHRRR